MKSFLLNNIYFGTLIKLNKFLDKNLKKKTVGVLLLVVLNVAIEIIGLSAVIPVILLALNPEFVESNAIIQQVYSFFGFTSVKWFVLTVVLTIFILFVLKNIVGVFINYLQVKFSLDTGLKYSTNQFRRYLFSSLDYMKSENSTVFSRNVLNIPTSLATYILQPILLLTTEFLVMLSIVIGLFSYDWRILLLLGITIMPTFILIYQTSKNKLQYYAAKQNDLMPEAQQWVFQAIFGFVDMKLLNKENYFERKFTEKQKEINNYSTKRTVMILMPAKVIETTALLGVVVIFFYSYLITKTPSELAALITLFALASYRVMPSVNRILQALMSLKSYTYIFDILFSIDELNNEEVGKPNLVSFNNNIEFKNVYFKYNEESKFNLKNINFTIKKGEVVGFIGRSGAGKTTLINIFLRFLNESEGGIYVDGVQLDKSNLRNWWNTVGYVQQNIYILDASLAENIAFGNEINEIDYKKLNDVIEKSKLKELVETLPNGVKTNMGEMGGNISGGQKQRIGIARALYKNCKVLVFDEATSALDSATEEEITDSINELAKHDITMLLIAHRITSLKNCNVILELDKGEIVGTCQYKELVEREMLS